MHTQTARRTAMRRFSSMILLAAAIIATVAYTTPPARGQAADVKTAEQGYKKFIAASLGVDCEFCHVQGKPEADDKGPKKTAREMITMTLGINKDSFRGQLRVTCFSCHRGSASPVSMPPVQESDTMPARPAAPAAPAAGGGKARGTRRRFQNPTPARAPRGAPPARAAGAAAATPDQIADKYLTAV